MFAFSVLCGILSFSSVIEGIICPKGLAGGMKCDYLLGGTHDDGEYTIRGSSVYTVNIRVSHSLPCQDEQWNNIIHLSLSPVTEGLLLMLVSRCYYSVYDMVSLFPLILYVIMHKYNYYYCGPMHD